MNCPYNILQNNQGQKLWQRNYWEHIIRDERAHYMIREYIQNNPTRWEADCFRGNNNELRESRTEYNPVQSIHELPIRLQGR